MAVLAQVRDVSGFDVEFVLADGTVRRVDLAAVWDVRFEHVAPVRTFPLYKGQSNFPGLRWSSTTGRHVPYESWLERDNAMLLDFDPDVVGYAAQPFWLHWDQDGKGLRHAPDYFVRLADGSGVVVDVRADDRIEEKDARAFGAMQAACALVGWEFRRVGVPGPVFAANVRWLAGYRYPRCSRPDVERRLREVFAEPRPLFDGAGLVGVRLAVLPVLFHLMWRRVLVADLESVPLGPSTIVAGSGIGAR